VTVDGLRVPAFYYVLNPPYEEEPPVDYYYETCAEGYRDWGLDLAYLDAARDRAQLAEEARGERAHVCAFCSERLPQKEMERLSRNEWLCNDCAAYMYGQHYYAKDMSRRRAAPVAENKEGPR
jgi:ribosomal protein L37AE/L43A